MRIERKFHRPPCYFLGGAGTTIQATQKPVLTGSTPRLIINNAKIGAQLAVKISEIKASYYQQKREKYEEINKQKFEVRKQKRESWKKGNTGRSFSGFLDRRNPTSERSFKGFLDKNNTTTE